MLKSKVAINKKAKWITLSLYRNCFDDGNKTHLGFKYSGVYYCLTHTKSNISVPNEYLRMKEKADSSGITYMTKATSKPKALHITNMRILRSYFIDSVNNK